MGGLQIAFGWKSAGKEADRVHAFSRESACDAGVWHGYRAVTDPDRMQATAINAVKESTMLLSLGLNYGTTNNNGNVLSQLIQPLGVTQNYAYNDGLNRINSFTEGSLSRSYAYDRYGNGWVPSNSGLPISPLTPLTQNWYDAATNRLTSTGYDGSGNQTQVNPFSIAYDGENRQYTSTETIGGTQYTTTYTYDGDGRRVKKVLSGGATTVYVYDAAGQLAAEYDSQGSQTTGTSYLTPDHLGSTRLVTDGTGTVVKRHDYMPFGEELFAGTGPRTTGAGYPASDDGTAVRQEFTGKERDGESGLDFFGARYMSSAQGRFTSPDEPFADWNQRDAQSWNLYSYVRNNPLSYRDEDGREMSCTQDDSGNIKCTVTKPKNPPPPPPKPDVVLDSPSFLAVARGVQQAKPGVDAAGAGLMAFFSFVAPFTTAATQCVAGNCDKTNLAMAAIPGGAEGEILEGLTRWGWAGTKKFLAAVRLLKQPGTHTAVEGIVPTLEEAKAFIQKAGGTIDRIEEGHAVGGVSEHTYPHINYTTPSGAKATVQVESIGK